jgi:tetratricopeptide (TPR) repeat protein
MDLLKDQRQLLMYLGAGVVGFALLVFLAVRMSGNSDTKHAAVSTEASTSPALNALLADVDKPEAPPVVDPAPAPVPAPVVATPPAAATPAAETKVASLDPAVPAPTPTPAPVVKPDPPKPPAPRPRPVKQPRRPAPGAASKSSSAERTAAALYKQREFARASDILLIAATKETGANAERLESLGKDYGQMGIQLAKGDAAAAANPIAAMAAYKQAFLLDARSGRGAHAVYLKSQLGKVLPRAATAFMQAGKFELARAACDDAAQFGGGGDPAVARARAMLEGKAKELYGQGATLARSKPDEAKALWRRVLKMVPAQSPWYSKSYAALNKSSKSPAQDEDE